MNAVIAEHHEDVFQDPVVRIDRIDRGDDPDAGVQGDEDFQEGMTPEIRTDPHGCRGQHRRSL
ncbi:MAG TPA: hypothetical protein VI932_00945 [Bacteroidota bacterium]|nr:hypothetical protein [Bacteroidota bacterium]